MNYQQLHDLFHQICELLITEECGKQMGFKGAFGSDSEQGVEFCFLFHETTMSMRFVAPEGFRGGDKVELDDVLDMYAALSSHRGGVSELFLAQT